MRSAPRRRDGRCRTGQHERQAEIDRLKNDARLLNRQAQNLLDTAGATVERRRQQIAAAEAGLKQALEDEKRGRPLRATWNATRMRYWTQC